MGKASLSANLRRQSLTKIPLHTLKSTVFDDIGRIAVFTTDRLFMDNTRPTCFSRHIIDGLFHSITFYYILYLTYNKNVC